MDDRKEVARTILEQLGGNGFVLMVGAKHLTAIEGGLSFKLPSNFAKDGINHVEVILTPMDVYTVKFMRVRIQRGEDGNIDLDRSVKIVDVHEDVYADSLRDVFERVTGLATRMPRFAVARC